MLKTLQIMSALVALLIGIITLVVTIFDVNTLFLKEQAKCFVYVYVSNFAEKGCASAQQDLGWIYLNGEGVDKDERKAARWYKLAAEHGDEYAQYNLGLMYSNGEGVVKDKREAASWFRLAAEQGHADAQYNLGVLYENGEELLDEFDALHWYQLAAEQDNAGALYELSTKYFYGVYIDKDESKARHLHLRAAEKGNVEAQKELGEKYYIGYHFGLKVSRDEHKAARWYKLAAEQGDADAQFNLARMFERGEGVTADKSEAYIWLSIAKKGGHEKADEKFQVISSELNSAEIQFAENEVVQRLEKIKNWKKWHANKSRSAKVL